MPLITTPMGTEPKAMYDEYGMPVLAGYGDGTPRVLAKDAMVAGFFGAVAAMAGIAVGAYLVEVAVDTWPYGKKRR